MRWVTAIGAAVLVGLVAGAALADEGEPGPSALPSKEKGTPGPWSVAGAVGIAGNPYTEGGYGNTIETNRVAFAALSFAPTYQLTPSIALALQGGLGIGLGEEQLVADRSQTVVELAFAARYQGELWDGWYVSGRAGAVAIRDRVGEQQATQWAPLTGIAVGHDFRVSQALSLGIELCGVHTWFGDEGHTFLLQPPNIEGPSARFGYGGTTWFGLNLTGRVLL